MLIKCQSTNELNELWVLSNYSVNCHSNIHIQIWYLEVSAPEIYQQPVISTRQDTLCTQPPRKTRFKQDKKKGGKNKLTLGFISGCSPSMCSARVSNERKRNGNVSHIHINILQCFPWNSDSCGQMPDNVMGMSAATTSTALRDYVLPLQRPFRVSGYRWDKFYFHFNRI